MQGFWQQCKTDGRENPLDHEFAVGNQEDHKRPEDDRVVHPEGTAYDPFLAKGVAEDLTNPELDIVGAVLPAAKGDQAEAAVAADAEDQQ